MGRCESLLTFIVVLLASSFALCQLYPRRDLLFLRGTYVIITLYSVLGILSTINQTPARLNVWLDKNTVLVETVAFPCFVTEIWLMYGVIQKEAAWIHVIIGAVPAIAVVFDNRQEKKWIDLVVYTCCVSLFMVCFQFDNVVGIECAVCFFIGYNIESNNVVILDRPTETSFNLFTAGFTLLTVIAVNGKLK